MADYTLNWTDPSLTGKTSFVVSESSIDTSHCSLFLTGKKSIDWGIRQQENYMHLLENFASSGAAPAFPTLGQTWYNASTNRLNVYDNAGVSGWQDLQHRRIDSPVQPAETHYPGDRWYDSTRGIFKIYGTTWQDMAYRRIDYPTAPTNYGATHHAGDLWFDTSVGLFKVYNGATYNRYVLDYGTDVQIAAGIATLGGPLNEVLGTNISAAATINLTTATGNIVHVTGAAGITAITLGNGMRRITVFDGASTITSGASLKLPGNPNGAGIVVITCAAGDTAEWLGDSAVTRCLWYAKATGVSVDGAVPPGVIVPYAGAGAPPAGYMICPVSAALVNVADFPALFAKLGYTWGGSGASFSIPWIPSGYTLAQAISYLAVGGHTVGDNLAHTHTYTRYAGKASQSGSSTPCWYSDATVATSSSGGAANFAAAAAVQFMVKY